MSERHPNGSETQEGPDWWMASDNRWYPPELHPEFRNARSVVLGEDEAGDAEMANVSETPEHSAGDGATTQADYAVGNEEVIPGLLGASPSADVEPQPDGAQSEHVPQAGAAGPFETAMSGFVSQEPATPETATPEPGTPETVTPDTGTFATTTAGFVVQEVAPAEAATPETATAESGTRDTGTPDSAAPDIAISGLETPETTSPETGALDRQAHASESPQIHTPGEEPSESQRPPVIITDDSASPAVPESRTERPAQPETDPDAPVNPWTLPVRGRLERETAATIDPGEDADTHNEPRIVLPGQLEAEPAAQTIRPSGPTPVAKSLTFRPAEPTTVQAAVNVPVADDVPWYKRPVDGSDPIQSAPGAHTPNINGGALSVAGGALAIVGALMTWATESGPLLDGFLWARKVPGFASNGGWVLVCGLLMGVAGVLSIIGVKPIGIWTIMSVVSGGLVLAAVLYSYADIVGSASDDWRTFVSASTGIDAVTLKARGVGLRPAFGLWLSAIAGLLGCAAGIYFKRDF